MDKVKVVIVGIGGYGGGYMSELLDNTAAGTYEVVGAVDPFPEASPHLARIHEAQIPLYADLLQFYSELTADLAVISSPIQFHCEQTKLALAHGSHVLCEKPLSATVQEAHEMIRARDQAGKFVAIGYQWSFSESIHQLKEAIMSGKFGKSIRLKTLVLWPRTDKYYARGWAGKIRDGKGNFVLDSIANNATAHYLHNMFYILGDRLDSSAIPATVEAELYRANAIENYDTAAMRCITTDGTELLYLGTHAVANTLGPIFHYEFEHAVITFEGPGQIVAAMHSGEEVRFGNPNQLSHNKLWQAIAAVQDGSLLPCGLETALSHTICINGMQESMQEIAQFPKNLVRRGELKGESLNYVEGLKEALTVCYEQNRLPHELDYSWAKAGNKIDLRNYKGLS